MFVITLVKHDYITSNRIITFSSLLLLVMRAIPQSVGLLQQGLPLFRRAPPMTDTIIFCILEACENCVFYPDTRIRYGVLDQMV